MIWDPRFSIKVIEFWQSEIHCSDLRFIVVEITATNPNSNESERRRQIKFMTVDQGPHIGSAVHSNPTRNIIDRVRIGRRADGFSTSASWKVKENILPSSSSSLSSASQKKKPLLYPTGVLTMIVWCRGNAAAEISNSSAGPAVNGDSPLGLVPHSLRGFLHRHQLVIPATESFYNCTACSPLVCGHNSLRFVSIVFNNNC